MGPESNLYQNTPAYSTLVVRLWLKMSHMPQEKLSTAGLQEHRKRPLRLFLVRFEWSKPPMVRQHRLGGLKVAHTIAGSSFMVEFLIFLPQGGGGGGA